MGSDQQSLLNLGDGNTQSDVGMGLFMKGTKLSIHTVAKYLDLVYLNYNQYPGIPPFIALGR